MNNGRTFEGQFKIYNYLCLKKFFADKLLSNDPGKSEFINPWYVGGILIINILYLILIINLLKYDMRMMFKNISLILLN